MGSILQVGLAIIFAHASTFQVTANTKVHGSKLTMSAARTVLVTGAGGQTGKSTLKKLLARNDEFIAVGMVRTEESKAALVAEGVPADSVVVGSIIDYDSVLPAVQTCDAVIIASSAKPVPGPVDPETGRPSFGFPNGQPEEVDWIGQKNTIDAAKASGVTQVVICSSMGGTNPDNMLNGIGRTVDSDGKFTGGNILLWKRKAEKYLIDSGLCYTIVHPGGLINESGGCRELVVGVDDEQVGTSNRSIPRDDVAEILIQSLLCPSYVSVV